jgi:tape measure domain-containing protein
MASSDLVFNVRAQTSSAVAGFKQLAASLKPVEKDAAAASKSLAAINKQKVAPKVDDHEITALTKEVARLQDEMRDAVKLDVNADTRKIQSKIRGLQSTIRTLKQSPTITPKVNTSFLTKLKTVGAGASTFFENLSNVVGGLGPIVSAVGQAAVGAARGIFGLVQTSLNLADAADRSRNTLKLFLGTFKEADKELKALTKFAAETPFELPEIKQSAQRLLGVGMSAKKTNQALKVLGDTAAAFGTDLEGVTTVWSQMMSAGKVNSEDMNQLVDRGIPAWKELGKAMGKTVPELKKMASEGKLGTEALDALFKQLGKDYAGQMKTQSGTFSGMVSTFKDAVNGLLTDIGEAILPFAKALMPAIQKAFEGFGRDVKSNLPGVIDAIAAGLQGLVKMPGMILRGLAGLTQGFLSTIASIEQSVGGLLMGLASALANIPGMGDAASALAKSALELKQAGAITAIQGNRAFEDLILKAAEADAALKPVADAIEKARQEAQKGVRLKIKNDATASLKEANEQLKKLGRQKSTPKVDADIRRFKRQKAEAQAALDKLNRTKATPKVDVKSNANTVAAATKRELANIPDETVRIIVRREEQQVNKGRSGPQVDIDGLTTSAAAQLAPPQIAVYLRDEKLADLLDVRINGRATRAVRTVRRRGLITV